MTDQHFVEASIALVGFMLIAFIVSFGVLL